MSRRRELGDVDSHALEEAALELQQVDVDAHPVTRVLPVGRLEVLALERNVLGAPLLLGQISSDQ